VDRPVRRRGARGDVRDDARDAGFTLVEVIVSLVLLAVVMSAALSLFVRAIGNTDLQAQRGQAITIANDQLEQVRALPVTDLLDGRTVASVNNLWTWDPGLVGQSVLAYDTTAVTGATELVPTLQTRTVDNVDYAVRTFVDTCYLPTTGTTTCGTASASAKAMYRITVSVAWSPRETRPCSGTNVTKLTVPGGTTERCQEYVVTTLRDQSSDATFNTN
jgi:prepilin-type N-terminal cleavage/methylation domain-containing protein